MIVKQNGLEARTHGPGSVGTDQAMQRDVVSLVVGVDIRSSGPDRDAQRGLTGSPPLAGREPDGTRGRQNVEFLAGQGAQVFLERREEDLWGGTGSRSSAVPL